MLHAEKERTMSTEKLTEAEILVEDTLLNEETEIVECGGNKDPNSDSISEELNKDVYIQEIKKAIEEKKDAEMNSKLEEMKKAEKTAIEIIRKEEENKYNILKKKFQALETKMRKKEEELEAQKNLSKLKQTKFLEDLQNSY